MTRRRASAPRALAAGLPLAVLAAGAAWPPAPARAEAIECRLAPVCARGAACPGDEVALAFAIDRAQLSPALDPADPPRRAVTTVRLDGHRFAAEPIVMRNGGKGFWAEEDGVTRMLVIDTDGQAVFTDGSAGGRYEGRCRDVR